MGKKRFRIMQHKDERGVNWNIYEPTVVVKGSRMISDNFMKKVRMRAGGLNSDFAVEKRRRKR